MSSTSTDIRFDGRNRRGQPNAPGPARRVRLPWIAAAAGIALLTAVLMLWGFGQVGDRREVVMMNTAVAEGDEITAADLGSTMIAVESSATQLFSVEQSNELIGRVAAVDLAAGDLIGPSAIETATAVPDGWVEVGAFVRSSRYPASMAPGDRDASTRTHPRRRTGPRHRRTSTHRRGDGVIVEVIAIQRGNDGAVLTVLAVPDDSSALVARWASSDNLVLVKVEQ